MDEVTLHEIIEALMTALGRSPLRYAGRWRAGDIALLVDCGEFTGRAVRLSRLLHSARAGAGWWECRYVDGGKTCYVPDECLDIER